MKGDKRKNQRTFEYLSTKENGESLWICDAIEWADETMINKVCEWLENVNTDDYMDSGIFQMYDMIMDFKKAMEE